MSIDGILEIVGGDTKKYLDLTDQGRAFLQKAGQRDLEAAVANYKDVIGSILKSVAVGGAKKRWKQLIGALFGFGEHGIVATWLGGSKETLQGYPAGLCKGKALEDEIEKAISKETGIERCTFAELGELCRTNSKKFKHLWVTVTKVHRNGDVSVERLTSERVATDKGPRWYDNVIVSSAVRASSNLPFVFEPCILKTKDPDSKLVEEREGLGQFLDGGMLANLDIEIFDAQHFQTQRVFLEDEGLRHKMNKRTLGIALVNREKPGDESETLTEFKVEDPLSLVQAVVKVYRSSEETLRALKPYNKRRIIEVDRIGVAATDFSLSDDKKRELFAMGKSSVGVFF
jgi:predicted acylesterase/phospholipase RssA